MRAARAEDLLEEAAQQALDAGELLREVEDRRALEHVVLGSIALDHPIAQALLERRELASRS